MLSSSTFVKKLEIYKKNLENKLEIIKRHLKMNSKNDKKNLENLSLF